MKFLNHSFQWRRGPYRVVAVVALLLFLFVFAMASSPALHELVHKDAHESGHECAALLLLHGQVDSPTPDAPPPAPSSVADEFVAVPASFISFYVSVLPPGRAPPVFCLAS